MKSRIVALPVLFCLISPNLRAEEPLAPRAMALDVIKWARHGSDRFSAKYADRALLAKKAKVVLYGKVFQQMAKDGELPKGYSLVTDDDLKEIDWSTTGMISIGRRLPEGGFSVSITTGPMGMCGYRVIPDEGRYLVRDNGGS